MAIHQMRPVAHLPLVLGVVRKRNVAALIETFCPLRTPRMSSHVAVAWRALSQTTENRKVETHKPLIFRDPIFGIYLQNPTLRQSRNSHTPSD